eukprot:TRINITY_DN5867_c0_g1_i1.p1 TRINITY_DN5867_c0_g1~~TRINITY_DN5867_c0_g1_i1.p1  ORF type:complete len:1050 (+),score=162.37 TRINITY_DN5867_c0_g1_i1:64-3213(+)
MMMSPVARRRNPPLGRSPSASSVGGGSSAVQPRSKLSPVLRVTATRGASSQQVDGASQPGAGGQPAAASRQPSGGQQPVYRNFQQEGAASPTGHPPRPTGECREPVLTSPPAERPVRDVAPKPSRAVGGPARSRPCGPARFREAAVAAAAAATVAQPSSVQPPSGSDQGNVDGAHGTDVANNVSPNAPVGGACSSGATSGTVATPSGAGAVSATRCVPPIYPRSRTTIALARPSSPSPRKPQTARPPSPKQAVWKFSSRPASLPRATVSARGTARPANAAGRGTAVPVATVAAGTAPVQRRAVLTPHPPYPTVASATVGDLNGKNGDCGTTDGANGPPASLAPSRKPQKMLGSKPVPLARNVSTKFVGAAVEAYTARILGERRRPSPLSSSALQRCGSDVRGTNPRTGSVSPSKARAGSPTVPRPPPSSPCDESARSPSAFRRAAPRAVSVDAEDVRFDDAVVTTDPAGTAAVESATSATPEPTAVAEPACEQDDGDGQSEPDLVEGCDAANMTFISRHRSINLPVACGRKRPRLHESRCTEDLMRATIGEENDAKEPTSPGGSDGKVMVVGRMLSCPAFRPRSSTGGSEDCLSGARTPNFLTDSALRKSQRLLDSLMNLGLADDDDEDGEDRPVSQRWSSIGNFGSSPNSAFRCRSSTAADLSGCGEEAVVDRFVSHRSLTNLSVCSSRRSRAMSRGRNRSRTASSCADSSPAASVHSTGSARILRERVEAANVRAKLMLEHAKDMDALTLSLVSEEAPCEEAAAPPELVSPTRPSLCEVACQADVEVDVEVDVEPPVDGNSLQKRGVFMPSPASASTTSAAPSWSWPASSMQTTGCNTPESRGSYRELREACGGVVRAAKQRFEQLVVEGQAKRASRPAKASGSPAAPVVSPCGPRSELPVAVVPCRSNVPTEFQPNLRPVVQARVVHPHAAAPQAVSPERRRVQVLPSQSTPSGSHAPPLAMPSSPPLAVQIPNQRVGQVAASPMPPSPGSSFMLAPQRKVAVGSGPSLPAAPMRQPVLASPAQAGQRYSLQTVVVTQVYQYYVPQ